MAYTIGKTSALQTAIKAGVDIALAEFSVDPTIDLVARAREVADELKVELFAQVDDDNKAVASSPAPQRSFGGSGNRSNGPVSVEDAKNLVLNFGWAKGMTIGDVIKMTAAEATGYSDGKYRKSGLDYIRWMANNKDPKGAFASARAKVALADFEATSADLAKLAG